ncbi:Phospholipase D [Ralstonia sp. LMG 32965]|uniref:phospholipase D family nuclease n=1 Tax=Ralstonia flatus TaxID=3058601 RepID=UPI0028F4F0BD|nr:phospholipase D family protein [Ralstonia sp. LMG 32965]CAJ0902686.1 Phospholipase D [Ralstonia sp. LMG 32965]
MKSPRLLRALIVGLALSWVGAAFPFQADTLHRLADSVETAQSVVVPASGSVEVGFSPKGGAEALVLRVIDSAQSDIKVLAYSFTSSRVTAALLGAARRGVSVSLVADFKSNVADDRSGKGLAALSALAEAGCDVRVISAYPIHHDKVLIVDRKTVEVGSFNFSTAAARLNSENVLVHWNNPALAKVYLEHFDRNYRLSERFRVQY